MTTLVDALNGGKVALFVDTPTGMLFVGGQTAHSKNISFEHIDISNKAHPEQRIFLEGEGRKLADITGEVIFSTDTAYEFMVAKADSKEKFRLIVRNVDNLQAVDSFDVVVTAIGDNPTANTAYASSITLSNTEDFSIKINYVKLLTSDSDNLFTSNNEQIYVKE